MDWIEIVASIMKSIRNEGHQTSFPNISSSLNGHRRTKDLHILNGKVRKNFNSTKMHFFALEYIPPRNRGGDYDKLLLQQEAHWIHDLSALKYPGLNDAFSFKSFLYVPFSLYFYSYSLFCFVLI